MCLKFAASTFLSQKPRNASAGRWFWLPFFFRSDLTFSLFVSASDLFADPKTRAIKTIFFNWVFHIFNLRWFGGKTVPFFSKMGKCISFLTSASENTMNKISVALLRIIIAFWNEDGLFLHYLFWTELTWCPNGQHLSVRALPLSFLPGELQQWKKRRNVTIDKKRCRNTQPLELWWTYLNYNIFCKIAI